MNSRLHLRISLALHEYSVEVLELERVISSVDEAGAIPAHAHHLRGAG